MIYDKITQHNKRTYTHSNIIIVITCLICILCGFCNTSHATSSNPVNVEIISDHNLYETYDANDGVNNSYIQRTSQKYFVNSWNVLAKNIAKLTSSMSYFTQQYNLTLQPSINTIANNQTTINSNITSLQTLVSTVNNSIGTVNGTLSGIRQDEQLIYTNIDSIQWSNSSAQYVGIYDSSGNLLEDNTTYSFPDYYVAFTGFHNDRDSVTKVNIPLSAWSGNPYVKSVSVYSGVALGKVSELYYFVETSSSNGINVYFTPSMPYSAVYIRVSVNGNFHTITPNLSYIQYIPNNKEDYFKIYDFIIQYNLLQKNNSVLESKVDNVIDAINDLSLVNNDVKINVNVSNNDSKSVQDIIPFIRSFFDNNISLSDFVGESSDIQNNWFSQQNQDMINSLSGGYINLYD